MNTTNQIFSWKRYTAALRKECVEKRLIILLGILAMYLFFLVGLSWGSKYEEIARMINFFTIVFGFMISSALLPSMAFSQLKSKTGRVELFTVPNSMTEKFAVRVTIYIIGFLLAFVACVQLADWTRYAFINRVVAPNNLIETFRMAVGTKAMTWGSVGDVFEYQSFTSIMYIAPFFFMGSILWPRWSALKSFAAATVIRFVESFIFYFLVGFLFRKSLEWGTLNFNHQYVEFDSVINIILIVASLVLAWYLFKRKDIVSLKWWK